jgi:hypothetical protein
VTPERASTTIAVVSAGNNNTNSRNNQLMGSQTRKRGSYMTGGSNSSGVQHKATNSTSVLMSNL